jgi:hypothetical protein
MRGDELICEAGLLALRLPGDAIRSARKRILRSERAMPLRIDLKLDAARQAIPAQCQLDADDRTLRRKLGTKSGIEINICGQNGRRACKQKAQQPEEIPPRAR